MPVGASEISASAGRVSNLVAGFSSPATRLLFMLRAFIDDSGTGQEPAFVMGGWIAPVEVWSDFEIDWREALERKPRLDYFKMKEAVALHGQFHRWTEQERDDRLRLLWSVIERYVRYGIYSIIPQRIYREVFDKGFHPENQDPYTFSAIGLVTQLAKHLEINGDNQPIDFVFDNTNRKAKIMVAWEIIERHFSSGLSNIAGPPIFRDDKTTLPLQAADLMAWAVRRDCEEFVNKRSRWIAPWHPSRDLLILSVPWTRAELRKIADFTRTLPNDLSSLEQSS